MDDKSDYFSSYEDLEVHRLMLEDSARTEAYKNAILSNEKLFKNKVVLDVGTGTGILSIFCAQAGASKVYAVEASNIAKLAKDVVEENGFSNIIEVFNCPIEEFNEDIKVDIIVSEWMGFYLFHEGMLDSVIYAREKFLKDDGYMFPEECALYAAPCQLPSFYQSWDDVHGVKMSSFSKQYRKIYEGKPSIKDVGYDSLLNDGNEFFKINLNVITAAELNTISNTQVVACKKDGLYQGICLWFVCNFPYFGDSDRVILSTKPNSPTTHWKQTVVVLPIEIEVEAGDALAWELTLQRVIDKPRSYAILLTMLNADEESHPIPCDCSRPKCLVIRTYLAQLPPEDEQDTDEDSEEENECNINTNTTTSNVVPVNDIS